MVDEPPSNNASLEPNGLGGWLLLVGLGQVFGILVTIDASRRAYTWMDAELFDLHPIMVYGDAVTFVGLFTLIVCTTILFLRRSAHFPLFFILQWLALALLPPLNHALTVLTMPAVVADLYFIRLNVVATLAIAVMGMIAITYTLRSRRVANTFC